MSLKCVLLMRTCCILAVLSVLLGGADSKPNQPDSDQQKLKIIAALTELGVINETTDYTLAESDEPSLDAEATRWDLKLNSKKAPTNNVCLIGLGICPILGTPSDALQSFIADSNSEKLVVDSRTKDLFATGKAMSKTSKPIKAFVYLLNAKRSFAIKIMFRDLTLPKTCPVLQHNTHFVSADISNTIISLSWSINILDDAKYWRKVLRKIETIFIDKQNSITKSIPEVKQMQTKQRADIIALKNRTIAILKDFGLISESVPYNLIQLPSPSEIHNDVIWKLSFDTKNSDQLVDSFYIHLSSYCAVRELIYPEKHSIELSTVLQPTTSWTIRGLTTTDKNSSQIRLLASLLQAKLLHGVVIQTSMDLLKTTTASNPSTLSAAKNMPDKPMVYELSWAFTITYNLKEWGSIIKKAKQEHKLAIQVKK
ncbi:hypothetical protein NEHOM01_1889 [Nematocida homosporus]|uniref:uncharacterized protein n=1 Tax=Nematocida homosporus TaxID=1912981 RepID=UPI002220656B|nr:uncharacterized protein NEHOM01_1889 [Nematocida homosporus]KAI5187044.1 hypothetical protein NEHOM01_1889 [Nematocida homosporus]